jgi:hypothetical protein
MASLAPVEAPDGTIASPVVPSASVTSTATVGFQHLDLFNVPIHTSLLNSGPTSDACQTVACAIRAAISASRVE